MSGPAQPRPSDGRLRFVGSEGDYKVFDGANLIGTVRYWERRYNLIRVYVSRGWRATKPDGERLYHLDGYTAGTRREAAKALRSRDE